MRRGERSRDGCDSHQDKQGGTDIDVGGSGEDSG